MARADYICCDKCGEKLIYDAYDSVIDFIDFRLTGEQSDTEPLTEALCEKCSGVGGILFRPIGNDNG